MPALPARGALARRAAAALLTVFLIACGAQQPPQPSPAPSAPPGEAFALRGPIQQITPAEWLVADVPVRIGAATTISGVPAIGAEAEVRGALGDDGAIAADTIAILAAPPTTQAPTSAPTPLPTATPDSPTPTAPPPAPTIAGLRLLIEAGVEAGHVDSGEGQSIIKRLDEAEEALAGGDAKKARDRLRDVQKKIREQVRDGRIEPTFGQQALAVIDTLSRNLAGPGGGGDNNDDD